MKVSVFKSVKDTQPISEPFGLSHIWEKIKEGKWKEKVERVRSLTGAKRKEAKTELPAYTASGIFKERKVSGLIKHSGYICVDIDDDTSKRKALEQDIYTKALHISCGGNGLAVYVRIEPRQHKSVYGQLESYYKDRYGIQIDPSCKDVSRLRFVSYDPNLYLRDQDPPVFSMQNFFSDEVEQAVQELEDRGIDLTKEYHDWVKIAFAFASELGEAGRELFHRVSRMHPEYNADDCNRKYNSCLKTNKDKVRINSFFHLAKEAGVVVKNSKKRSLEYAVREKRKKGLPADQVTKELSVNSGIPQNQLEEYIERIYEEQMQKVEAFWRVEHDEKKEKYNIHLSDSDYIEWLNKEGFYRYKTDSESEYRLVHVHNNIVREVVTADVRKHVRVFIEGLPFEFDHIYRIELKDKIMKSHKHMFDKALLDFLPDLPDRFERDTQDCAYFYFTDQWAKVTKAEIVAHEYKKLPHYVWDEEILDHPLGELIEDVDRFDFDLFLQLLAAGDENRYLGFLTALGYLVHSYKDPAVPKVVILCDETISDKPAGGTGKGIFIRAVSEMRKTIRFDGKNFDLRKNFAFQRITPATRVMALDDVPKFFDFERFFSMITEGLVVEQKNRPEFHISYSESPKMVITSNYAIGGISDSDVRRRVELEVAPHFGPTHTPRDEFKRNLFDDWSKNDWSKFYNMVMSSVQIYLNTGLKQPKANNLPLRKLMQETCQEFPEYMDREVLDKIGERISKADLYDNFIEEFGWEKRKLHARRFRRWIEAYARFHDLDIFEVRETDENLIRRRFYYFKKMDSK